MKKGYAVSLIAAVAIGSTASLASANTTYLPHGLAVKTNNLYGHDCFWAPPSRCPTA